MGGADSHSHGATPLISGSGIHASSRRLGTRLSWELSSIRQMSPQPCGLSDEKLRERQGSEGREEGEIRVVRIIFVTLISFGESVSTPLVWIRSILLGIKVYRCALYIFLLFIHYIVHSTVKFRQALHFFISCFQSPRFTLDNYF